MRASSAITTRSHESAMSLPPATAYPCTLATVGLADRQSEKKWSVLAFIPRKSLIGSQTSPWWSTPPSA
jgi:hypothetical protein